MIFQLDPPIPLSTPKGDGYAHLVLDYGQEFHLLWVTFIDETGECWTFPNPEIRLQLHNPSMGRDMKKPMGKKLEANSTGALSIGGAKDRDISAGGKKAPIDKGEKGMKQKSPMRKGR